MSRQNYSASGTDLSSWTIKTLSDYVGGLSAPSKMPGWCYSLPAKECKVGSKLVNIEGSTCSGCYALKGRYNFSNVQAALYRRLAALDRPLWVEVMAELIRRKTKSETPYFRWHDSGDLQSVEHLGRICEVALLTPLIWHWLPTREYRMCHEYITEHGSFPPNLQVRLSAHMVGKSFTPPASLLMHTTISTVSEHGLPGAFSCPARHQGNSCGDCRACWSGCYRHVDYHLH